MINLLYFLLPTILTIQTSYLAIPLALGFLIRSPSWREDGEERDEEDEEDEEEEGEEEEYEEDKEDEEEEELQLPLHSNSIVSETTADGWPYWVQNLA